MNEHVDYQLTNKTALITGVSRKAGIGAAIALALARSGANVFTTYYRPYDSEGGFTACDDDAQQIIGHLRSLGVRACGIEADLSDANAPSMIFDCAEREIGPVDILVNNAAVDITPTDLYTLSADVLDWHYAVNLRAPTLLSAKFARRHDGRPGGRIINLTSGQGLHPMPDNLPYAVTKAGIECLTTCLSVTLASKNITVNAVDPGATDTGWMTDHLKSNLRRSSIGGRVGQPIDAARMVTFLASAQAEWVTGQIIRSRGGLW